MSDILNGKGVEIQLINDKSFLIIKETLTRMGIASKKEQKLFQSCHILHKKNRYWIIHFKELFELDGKQSNIVDNDIARRNTIVGLLEDWNLLKIIQPEQIENNCLPLGFIKIIPAKEKKNWQLISKYTIGNKK